MNTSPRQGQTRGRSRGRGGRRHASTGGYLPNRIFESNGPDVKVRGTAQYLADRYQQLARDAQVSGDRVMAENYSQHAEHYTRIFLQTAKLQTESFEEGGCGEEEEEELFPAPAEEGGGMTRAAFDDSERGHEISNSRSSSGRRRSSGVTRDRRLDWNVENSPSQGRSALSSRGGGRTPRWRENGRSEWTGEGGGEEGGWGGHQPNFLKSPTTSSESYGVDEGTPNPQGEERRRVRGRYGENRRNRR